MIYKIHHSASFEKQTLPNDVEDLITQIIDLTKQVYFTMIHHSNNNKLQSNRGWLVKGNSFTCVITNKHTMKAEITLNLKDKICIVKWDVYHSREW